MMIFRSICTKETARAISAILALSLAFLVYGVGGTRALQLWCFLFPASLLFLLSDYWRQLRIPARLLLGLTCALSAIDTGIRGFLKDVYQSDILSGFVVESVANTHTSESLEFIGTVWPDLLFWSALALLTFVLQIWFLRRRCKQTISTPIEHRRIALGVLVFLLTLSAVSWIVRPWRHQFPVLSWLRFQSFVVEYQLDWQHAEDERQQEVATAKNEVLPISVKPRTVVLMIGESITRDNMSLYGYPRQTTPQLDVRATKDPQFHFIPDAWSIDASTVASFRTMFDFRVPYDQKEPTGNVFAFFRAAGYQITWISNQDDQAIKSEWIAHSDKQIILNRLAGRSSRSMDDVTLAPLKEALADPAPHKLIVVHMIGAHPHFSLRYPEGLQPTWSDNDEVSQKMKADNRSLVVQHSRNQYDLAVLYQDRVLAESLALTEASSKQTPAFWLYLSDHGVETGAYDDRSGHSQTTPSGYRIPVLMWASPSLSTQWAWSDLQNRSFRSDWLPSVLFSAAGIELQTPTPPSVLSKDYQWQDPPSKTRFLPKQ